MGDKKSSSDGKKVVQVEVRKKRVISANTTSSEKTKELDAATQAKLKLIAEAKEHDAKRQIEEEEKQQQRKKIEEEVRIESAKKEAYEAQKLAEKQQKEEQLAKEKAELEASSASQIEFTNDKSPKTKDRHSKNFNDYDDDDDNFSGKKYNQNHNESFDQDRKKITKRSFEPQRRNNKVSIHSFNTDDEDDDYGFGAPHRRFKKKQPKPVVVQQPQEKIIKEVIIPEVITVQELANRMAEKSAEVIKKLMSLGVMATINQAIDADTAQIIVEEMGHKWKRVADSDVEDILKNNEDNSPDKQLPRAPVVTVMGHVDHGKTSLLDALRETNVAAKEAGGITQHIGAYQIEVSGGKKITFIDTPGHEAFSEMRARGAKVTDIVVLVVAANDGIMPQTIEAIRHAQAAEVPIVVAINKIDLPGADPMKVKTALLQHGIAVEEMGGECLCAEVSAKKRINIEKLLEAILLQAEILDLKANPSCKAVGTVIEAKMEKGRGSVATLLVQQGTLQIGDIIIAGKEWGHVRAMFNEHGQKIQVAAPATPVEVLGLQGTPAAGDNFNVVESEGQAKEITGYRIQKERDAKLVKSAKSAMEQMLDK
ncbi:MAG: translation initiation factor IF-2, partial [Alphaproteobacteria bacterium]|nr:translation initiation factor IF-2 [Alphaproteobacteria bacterium]